MEKQFRPLLAAVAALAWALAFAPAANAGPPGTWTLTTGPHTSTVEIGVARTPDGTLHLLWPDQGPLSGSVIHSSISADAQSGGGPDTVFTYPGGLNNRMALITEAGGLRAFFSGLFGSASSPLQGLMATATSADGASWTVQPSPASNDTTLGRSPVYAGAGIGAALGADGIPISTWGDSSPGSAGYHVGLSAAGPDIRFSSDCCVYAPNIGVDSITGEAFLAWQYLQGTSGTAYMSLTPGSARRQPPGSGAAAPETRSAISGRIGADGVYIAYLYGSNQFTSVPAIVRAGTSDSAPLSGQKGAQMIGLAAAPEGRMWAFWKYNGKITARRSDPAVNIWGAPVTVNAPASTSAIYNLAGEGSLGPLDLLALADTSGGIDNWHQRILPGLKLVSKKAKGSVKFKVTDAGAPVKGAKVTAGSKSGKTNSKGQVKLSLRKGKYKAKAVKDGYTAAKLSLRLK